MLHGSIARDEFLPEIQAQSPSFARKRDLPESPDFSGLPFLAADRPCRFRERIRPLTGEPDRGRQRRKCER